MKLRQLSSIELKKYPHSDFLPKSGTKHVYKGPRDILRYVNVMHYYLFI